VRQAIRAIDTAEADLWSIRPAGGDTAAPRNLRKRVGRIEALAGPLRGRRVIDCGCGSGGYVRALADRGADVFGIEIEASKLREAALAPDLAGRVESGDVAHLGFEDGSFDVALLNEVLEHVPDDRRALREVHRILRPGGRLVIFSPTRIHPFETHGVRLRGSGRRVPHWVPFVPWIPVRIGRWLVDYWARNYWPSELRARVRESGFEILHTGSVWQTFENISGHQPGWLRRLAPRLRAVCERLERTPVLRAFGVSQLIVAEKPVPGDCSR
jgi:SAM-dependent methyltransferase